MSVKKQWLSIGFQDSVTSGSELRIYSRGGDPVLTNAKGRVDMSGRQFTDERPAIVGLSTSKQMGPAAGTWEATVKCPESWGTTQPDLLERVVDDDWADIQLSVSGRKTHVMRGLVRGCRRVTRTSGNGAKSRTYTLHGEDHGRIWQVSPMWFNQFRAENAASQETLKLFQSFTIGGAPNVVTKKILLGFLETLTGKGQANFELPEGMAVSGNFVDNVVFEDRDFDPEPLRKAVSLQFDNPNGVPLWNFAQSWSDPEFCELFVDLMPNVGKYFQPDVETAIGQTLMGIHFRNRPFPITRLGPRSLWFDLPVVEVPEQFVVLEDIGLSGDQRFNAFFVAPQVLLETTNRDLCGPLWDVDDIRRHGLRKFDVESRYVADQNNLLTMSSTQRDTARDFHCLNPYLLSGTIGLAGAHPNIRIGHRLRIIKENDSQQLEFYVESVTHRMDGSGKGATSLGVTRGWRGQMTQYLAALEAAAGRYSSIIT